MAIPIYIGLHYGQNERQSSSLDQTRLYDASSDCAASSQQRAAAEKSAHLPTARFMICLLDCRARLSQSQSHSQSQSQSPSGSATGTRLCSHHLRIFRSNKINKNALILCSLSKHAVRSSCVPPTLYPANICTGYAILMTSTKDRRASAASASASATASAKSSASSH